MTDTIAKAGMELMSDSRIGKEFVLGLELHQFAALIFVINMFNSVVFIVSLPTIVTNVTNRIRTAHACYPFDVNIQLYLYIFSSCSHLIPLLEP